MELRSTETAHVDPQSEEWFASYAEPSNEPSHRHRRNRHRNSRDVRRHQRRHRLNTVMMIMSVVFVGAMTACFYIVLSR
jgi:hypothetical protein